MPKNDHEEVYSSATNEQLAQKTLDLDNEMRELDLEIKRETVAKIRQKRQEAKDKVLQMQQTIAAFLSQRILRQKFCNHRKGGTGAQAVLQGAGQSAMYCVIKHKLPVGKYFVLCQRCGKEWHPALTALENAGVPTKATKGYFEALQYPTNNSESGASLFNFRPADEVIESPEEE